MPIPQVSELKTLLQISTSNDDELLALYLAAAVRLVEARTGPLTVRTFTERITTNRNNLLLAYRPVVAITTVTQILDSWDTVTPDLLAFDSVSGVVYRTDFGTLAGSWDITYVAGWQAVPESWQLAILVTAEHLWRTARGAAKRPSSGPNDMLTTRPSTPSELPQVAQELLSDAPRQIGIA
jgi:uncharacterized phiE125 gp8 family phage protein